MTEENVLMSGGAAGADVTFGKFAELTGHTVIHFNFKGHKSSAPTNQLIELPEDLLLAADEYVLKSNLILKRTFPTKNNFVNNLLRRNWYQVENSERVYAVTTIKNGMIQGGTAWAVVMYTHVKNRGEDASECYVFCQNSEKWFKWKGSSIGWINIDKPPSPHGVWTGIGSRDLKDNGKNAIINLLEWN